MYTAVRVRVHFPCACISAHVCVPARTASCNQTYKQRENFDWAGIHQCVHVRMVKSGSSCFHAGRQRDTLYHAGREWAHHMRANSRGIELPLRATNEGASTRLRDERNRVVASCDERNREVASLRASLLSLARDLRSATRMDETGCPPASCMHPEDEPVLLPDGFESRCSFREQSNQRRRASQVAVPRELHAGRQIHNWSSSRIDAQLL